MIHFSNVSSFQAYMAKIFFLKNIKNLFYNQFILKKVYKVAYGGGISPKEIDVL